VGKRLAGPGEVLDHDPAGESIRIDTQEHDVVDVGVEAGGGRVDLLGERAVDEALVGERPSPCADRVLPSAVAASQSLRRAM
jgi:hypothetical protein